MVTRMREKGQVTIPLGIRESLYGSKDSILSVVKVGNGILLMQKPEENPARALLRLVDGSNRF